MQSFHDLLRNARQQKGLLLREAAAALKIDQALISKFEKGGRKPTRELVIQFAKLYSIDKNDLLISWMSEKVAYDLQDEEMANEILKAAEKKISYKRRTNKK